MKVIIFKFYVKFLEISDSVLGPDKVKQLNNTESKVACQKLQIRDESFQLPF